MQASNPTTTATETSSTAHSRQRTTDAAQGTAANARRDADAGFNAIRAAAADVAERVPVMVETVRTQAVDQARTIQAWPESDQRLLAVFSAGVGLGLMISGAPRLLVAGALVPAFAVAASTMGRDAAARRHA
jgi:hypothetical protein